jgi:hypothetical protein
MLLLEPYANAGENSYPQAHGTSDAQRDGDEYWLHESITRESISFC